MGHRALFGAEYAVKVIEDIRSGHLIIPTCPAELAP